MAPDDPTLTRPPVAPADADTLAAAPAAAGPLPPLPGYDLEAELGRGGMGVVYRARQVKANRRVAVKVILSGAHAGDADRRRFQAEAEVIARLDHPNVVRVFDVGEAAGIPYFALELCPGGTLATKLDGTPWPARPAAETVAALADGVAAAHAHGIVHRDLKPGNVLLAADGTPKVTDFGLAKSVTGDSGLTATGAVLGTPSYMAPEQAAGGREVGPAADVYSLGAILYELLTGRPPFKGATVLDTLDQVRRAEPAAPRALNAQAPRDLETVALKCLHKDPARRYASAADLAADLRRWLADEPIRARPVGRLERGRKWVKRNPAVAGLLAAVVLLTAGAFTAVTLALVEARYQQAQAEQRRKDLLANNDDLRTAQNDLTAASWAAREAGEANAHSGYISSVGLAQRLWLAGDAAAARQELDRCPERFRQWEWKYLDRQVRASGTTLRPLGLPLHLAYTPDGQYLVCGIQPMVTVFRAADGKDVLRFPIWLGERPALAVDRAGRRLAYVDEDRRGGPEPTPLVARVVSLPDGKALTEYRLPPPFGPLDLAPALGWGRDDQLLLARFLRTDNVPTLETWDLATGKRLATNPVFRRGERTPPARAEVAAFSPDGKRVAAVVQAVGSLPRGGADGQGGGPEPAAWIKVWDVWTGKEQATFPVETDDLPGLAYSPDGRFLAWGNGTQVAEADLDHPGPPRFLGGHLEAVRDVAYSPDGRILVSGGNDRVVRVWDRAEGREVYALRGAGEAVLRVAVAAGGREVAAAEGSPVGAGGRFVRRWPMADPAARTSLGPPPPKLSACLAVAPVPGRFLTVDTLPDDADHLRVALHDPAGVRPIPRRDLSDSLEAVSFSADGRRVALFGDGVVVLNADTGVEVARFPVPRAAAWAEEWDLVALSADGRRVAHARVVGRQKPPHRLEVRVWDVDAARPAGDFAEDIDVPPDDEGGRFGSTPASALAFDRTGGRLAAAVAVLSRDRTGTRRAADGSAVVVWDLAAGGRVFRAAPAIAPRAVAFDPDGHLAVGGGLGADTGFRLLDGATGRELMALRPHGLPVLALAFSPDGRRLVTTGEDRLVKVWSWGAAGGRELLTLAGHTRAATAVTFNPDGRYLITGTGIDRVTELTGRAGPPSRRPMEVKVWDAGP